MGKHSQLGPIDPQVPIAGNFVPASSLRRQFKHISDECAADPSRLSAWLPILQQYPPAILEVCKDADDLARSLVEQWLGAYMFAGQQDAAAKAKKAADFFADTDIHKSHGRSIDREGARREGLTIEDLEDDDALQDAVLSVHHAFLITLGQTSAVKIFENHLGAKVVARQQVISMPVPVPMPSPAPPAPGPVVPPMMPTPPVPPGN